MTFYKGTIAKIKYFVRTIICKLGNAVPLLNTNPGGSPWRMVSEWIWQFCHAFGWRTQTWTEKRWDWVITSLNAKNRNLQLILEKVSLGDTQDHPCHRHSRQVTLKPSCCQAVPWAYAPLSSPTSQSRRRKHTPWWSVLFWEQSTSLLVHITWARQWSQAKGQYEIFQPISFKKEHKLCLSI